MLEAMYWRQQPEQQSREIDKLIRKIRSCRLLGLGKREEGLRQKLGNLLESSNSGHIPSPFFEFAYQFRDGVQHDT